MMALELGCLNTLDIHPDGKIWRVRMSPRLETFLNQHFSREQIHRLMPRMFARHEVGRDPNEYTAGVIEKGVASYASKVVINPMMVVFYIRSTVAGGMIDGQPKVIRRDLEAILPDELTGDEVMGE